MAIHSLQDFTELSLSELYTVYLAIARADHQWRIRALYGDQPRPIGHTVFRPLPMVHFAQRLEAAQGIVGGERSLRARLSRQAAAYRVDVRAELKNVRSIAA